MAIDNNMPIFNTYKEGSNIEVFRYTDLHRAVMHVEEIGCEKCKEHVTWCMRKGFKKESIDTIEELEKAREEYNCSILTKEEIYDRCK